VLLYHVDGADDLLLQAILKLGDRRIGKALAAATEGPRRRTLAAWVREIWPVLVTLIPLDRPAALAQAIEDFTRASAPA
jgi:hypothetical protein